MDTHMEGMAEEVLVIVDARGINLKHAEEH